MENLGDRIKKARESSGISQKELSARLHISRSAVSQWESSESKGLKPENLVAVARILGVSVEWLVTGRDLKQSVISTREPRGDYVTLEPGPDLPPFHRTPVVGLAQLGPDGYYDAIEYPVGFGDGYLDVPTRDPNAYALKVRGDSMFPAIRDGWYVVIEPNRDHHPGDFVMVKTFDGRCMIKELLHERNGEIVLGNVNGNYGRLTLEREQVEKISLVGGIYPPSKYQPDGGA